MPKSLMFTITPDVLAQEVSSEIVLLDLNNEQYLGLNEVGARVWQLLKMNADLNTIYETLLSEYDVDNDMLKADINQLITDMQNAGIIQAIEKEA